MQTEDFSNIHIAGLFIAVVLSFFVAVFIYEPLAATEFDFAFFEDFSVSKFSGQWSYIVKYVSSSIYSILTGISYYFCARKWKLPIAACLPLAFVFGAISMAVVVVILGIVFIILATILLFLALLFGRGDR